MSEVEKKLAKGESSAPVVSVSVPNLSLKTGITSSRTCINSYLAKIESSMTTGNEQIMSRVIPLGRQLRTFSNRLPPQLQNRKPELALSSTVALATASTLVFRGKGPAFRVAVIGGKS